MTFLLYLGKVMLCSGILLGYYWLFLRNKRFHHYNRFYLQATLLFSVTLPLIRIPVWNKPQNGVNQVMYQTLEVLTVNYGEDDGLQSAPGTLAKLFTLENMLYLIYSAGIMLLLWTLARSLMYIRKISTRYPFERIGELKFYTTREPNTPFSFFRSIFWNNDLSFNSREGQQIFRHELFHVQQKHSADIVLAEIITAFFWFNPFFHLLKKELKAIHEFLADQYAISDSDRYAYAELLVLQTLKTKNGSITNHFFQNHIKRRIAMITNNQSTRYSYRSRLMALPVLALVFCTVALYAQRSANALKNIYYTGPNKTPITVIIDAGHGGSDAGAYSKDGKVAEKDLTLQISQKIQQLAPSYNVNVVMTRTDNNLPTGTTDKNDGLRARTALAEKIKPDMYISIHISHSDKPNGDAGSGFEVWVSNKENERTNQSKQLGTALAQELSKIYTTDMTLKQRTKNIWVLEQTPCPAVLIECGFIDNEKDLAFISNTSNQEAVAKKILEGIVNSRQKTTAAVSEPAPSPSAYPVPKATPAATRQPAGNATQPLQVSRHLTANTGKDSKHIDEDSILFKIAWHYRRSARYPKKAMDNHVEGVVYFSLAVNKNGEVNNIKFYDQAPPEIKAITSLTSVGLEADTHPAISEPLTRREMQKLLEDEVKRVFDNKLKLSADELPPAQYYFEVNFRIQKKKQPAV
ncbi:N-acetylmuramoyl-L-alanine amidase [Longitalea luteola]|uniref:N-acetylmuramoyl-L-alanine amidase n=1 Tax=Longitalea luteola TaxID=2812563 RepID=UPI001A976C23|nr:N-acetylmuramoyl-L-alanine amidase [Longitalea luteola]